MLRDRAYAFVAAHQLVPEDELLSHTYGGPLPPGLRAQLAAPLHDDPRLERRADGCWTVVGQRPPPTTDSLREVALTTLALSATGPNPERGRVVRVSAEHVQGGNTLERFSATVNPGGRVPQYVAQRLGLAPEVLDELPPFAAILDDLVQFLGGRPLLAQDARLTWAFLIAEARRTGQVLAELLLVDLNEIATRVLDLKGKPTLALVAAQFKIGTVRIARPEEEARVLALVWSRLLARATEQGRMTWATLLDDSARARPTALRRGQTALSLPDEPGVYVLRDPEKTPLYVGKARRLRSRVAAYVHRPLGATRRLEGLVGSVDAVDSTVCETDLEALILEDREIRRLQPRFNTVRQQRTPRIWIRLPPLPALRPGKSQLAARRLEPSLGPGSADGEFVGPFRNATLAEQARRLAREVFELDSLRRGHQDLYAERLELAWQFLSFSDHTQAAEALARQRSSRLLKEVLAFDLDARLLPADPRFARYAVIRPGPSGIEGFVVDHGILRAWRPMHGDEDDASTFAADLLTEDASRTTVEDVDVVLRWLGAQRPPAQLLLLPTDAQAAADAIEDAALRLTES